MPKAYFDPENLEALSRVLAEAKSRLNRRDVNDPTMLDLVAARILHMAAEGMDPEAILQQELPDLERPSVLREKRGERQSQRVP